MKKANKAKQKTSKKEGKKTQTKKEAKSKQKDFPKEKEEQKAKKFKGPKLKLGFFSFSSCEGCQLIVTELKELPELAKIADVSVFNLLKESPEELPEIDIALIEGAISTEKQAEELKKIREKAKTLVAYGACAIFGGITSLRNSLPKELQEKIKKEFPGQTEEVFPLGKFVKVDFIIRGCPIERHVLLEFLTHFLHRLDPVDKTFAVCVECKERENPCLLLEGEFCLGAITAAGCNALCPSNGAPCDGCRGFYPDANFPALKVLLERYGFSVKDINEKLGKYYFNI